jgi:AraC-like DNA-binding protein
MQHIDINTDLLDPGRRGDAWRESLTESFGPIEVVSGDTSNVLHARYRSTLRSGFRFNTMLYSGAGLKRSSRSVAADHGELFTLTMPEAGRLFVEHENVERMLDPSGIYLFNHSVPYSTRPKDEYGTTSIGFSASQLRRRIPNLQPFYSLRRSGDDGLAAQLVDSFARHVGQAVNHWDEHEFLTLTEQLLDLVALLIVQRSTPSASETSTRIAHRERARRFICEHLEDESLCPRTVADACRISLSYLHQLFREGDRSVEATITEERLLLARRRLIDPACSHMAVASIGYECGFNDATHFSRAFKRRFGMTPGDARRG